MTGAIVNLSCGCFFQGRDFHAAQECEEHADKEQEEPEEMNEYAFDVELKAAIRVKAESESEARAKLASLDTVSATLSQWPDYGNTTCEVSIVLNGEKEAYLYQINGKEV